MYKHIGRHGDKKVVLIYRQIPGEDHMCLVVYSDTLPRMYHDEVMKILESPVGQQAESFADALFRSLMPDGTNCLETLHRNHFMKKINTNQVIMTPSKGTTIRLDELNELLNEMKKGSEAVARMAEIDANRGMTSKSSRRTRTNEDKEVGVSPASRSKPANVPQNLDTGVLTDADLAASRLEQAKAMKASAAQLLAEAERLSLEAAELDPSLKNVKTAKPKKKAAAKTA